MINYIFEDYLSLLEPKTLQILENWGSFDSFHLIKNREKLLCEIPNHGDRMFINQVLWREQFAQGRPTNTPKTEAWTQETRQIYSKAFKLWGYPPANSVVSIGGRTPRRLIMDLWEVM